MQNNRDDDDNDDDDDDDVDNEKWNIERFPHCIGFSPAKYIVNFSFHWW